MHEVQRNTANSVMVFMIDSVDHVSGKTGLTLSVSLSKAGGAFNAISPIVTERGSGWYNIDLTAANCDTPGELVVTAAATGADAAFKILFVVDYLSISVSEVSICNMALAHCGVTMFIESTSESSQQADLCNLFYAPTRDKVLQAFPWPFARKYTALQDLEDPPANWGFRYLYPADCLKLRNIINNGYMPFYPGFYPGYYADESVCLPVRVPYQIGLAADGSSRIIYTNIANAQAEYTVKVTDVTLFPQTFINALAWALAAELAIPLTTDMNRAQLAQTKYAATLLEAGADALNEGVDGPQPESDFIRARR
jgi:hypothetical protein